MLQILFIYCLCCGCCYHCGYRNTSIIHDTLVLEFLSSAMFLFVSLTSVSMTVHLIYVDVEASLASFHVART